MTKRFHPNKLIAVWIAISAAVIIAGIILYALLGFQFTADKTESKTFEVRYDVALMVEEDDAGVVKTERLKELCEEQFAQKGIDAIQTRTYQITNGEVLEYTFSPKVDGKTLSEVRLSVQSVLSDPEGLYANSETIVTVHTLQTQTFSTAQWRGAVGIAVGVIVALVYFGFRFGLGSALTGLIVCVHDVLFTLALLAITRIPLYVYSPLIFAAIAAAFSLLMWGIVSAKLREQGKGNRAPTAVERMENAENAAWKSVTVIAVSVAVCLLIVGAIAVSGVRMFLLPAIIPVAVSVYSSLLVAPSLHVHWMSLDRYALKRKRSSKTERSAGRADD